MTPFNGYAGGKVVFLKDLRRQSTLAVASAIYELLVDHPEGAPVNAAKLARETGFSDRAVRRAIARLLQKGKLVAVEGYEVGKHPGRPMAYTLGSYCRKAEYISDSAKRRPNNSKSTTSTPKISPLDTSRRPSRAKTTELSKEERLERNLKLPVSERGLRWALGEVRITLARWGVPGAARAEVMAGVGPALSRARESGRIHNGRELGQTVRLILRTLEEDWGLRASKLAKREGRALYSAAGAVVGQAVSQMEQDRAAAEAADAVLARIRWEREAAREAWRKLIERGEVAHVKRQERAASNGTLAGFGEALQARASPRIGPGPGSVSAGNEPDPGAQCSVHGNLPTGQENRPEIRKGKGSCKEQIVERIAELQEELRLAMLAGDRGRVELVTTTLASYQRKITKEDW